MTKSLALALLAVSLVAAPAAAHHGWSSYDSNITILGALRNVEQWDQGTTAPRCARLHAAASLLIWLGVITCGLLIAYV